MPKSPALPCTLLCVLAAAPALLPADLISPNEYEGKSIAEVRFDPAEQPLAPDDLKRAVSISPGAPLHLTDVRAAIKLLYSTGAYDAIEVDMEPTPAGGVSLIFRTATQWFVGPVEAKGKIHQPPSSNQLVTASRLDLGAPFSDGDVDTAVQRLRSLLQRNGLYR